MADLVEEETHILNATPHLEDLVVEEEEDLVVEEEEDLVVEEEEDQSHEVGVSVSVLLADQEEEEEEILAENPDVQGRPLLREDWSVPGPEPGEAAGGEPVVGLEGKGSCGTTGSRAGGDEGQESVSIEKFVQAQDPGPGSDNIIDITDDSEDEEEVFPEIPGSRELEVETREDSSEQLVKTIIEDLIQFVVEQDPEVIIEGILDEVIDRAVGRAAKEEKAKTPTFQFACEDIRYKKKSTNSEDSADQPCALSLLLLPRATPTSSGRGGAQERPDQLYHRFISSMSRRKQISEKSSEPKDFMRVDYLFKSSGDRAKFRDRALVVSKDFPGMTVHMMDATEKELGSKEKPILSENEIMWIYSEAKTCNNLFADFAPEVVKEGSGSSSPVKFRFGKEGIQLNTFLACVLKKKEEAFLGKVRKLAKVTLPLRLTSLVRNGNVVFPVEVAGVPANLLRKQEGKFGFKIVKVIEETLSIQVEFQTSFQFYRFWTSKFSSKLNKVKFSQVTLTD